MRPGDRAECAAASLNDKLEHVVLRLFYQRRERVVGCMRPAIALNGTFLNPHRMMQQSRLKAYFE